MSGFWVLERLFKASAALINWSDEAGSLGYEGPFQPASTDPAPVHLRWLLHPALGLPRSPFVLWHNHHPGGDPTPQELADLPNWEPIELVGLPVDGSWGGTGYDLDEQGPNDDPLSPVDAAAQRLQLGAPRIGWTRLALGSGETLPDWVPPNLEAYATDVLEGALLAGTRQLLIDQPDPLRHSAYTVTDSDTEGTGRLNPHLLLQQDVVATRDEPAGAAWHPLGLLLLASGTDPLASLFFGFGTATRRFDRKDDIYMVSVRHAFRVGGLALDIQLADVVGVEDRAPAPGPPQDVAAQTTGHTRAQMTDGAAIDTVAVTWRRPPNPSFGHLPASTPRPVSFAVGRLDDGEKKGEILLPPRRAAVKGWQLFAPSKPDLARPVRFTDHLVRATTVDGAVVGQPDGSHHTYAVAAQDLFGRFGRWSTASYASEEEPPQTPRVLSVSLEPTGELTVDVGWDWSTRSPEFIELRGAFDDDPGDLVLSQRLGFGGRAEPNVGPPDLIPLSAELTELSEFGPAQDRDAAAPEVRFYRLRTSVGPVAFSTNPCRAIQVRARGQAHLNERLLPGSGVSAFGDPVTTSVYDPTPPPAPGGIPEAPQWASLPDASGVSRAVLRWADVPGAAGYVLYEATETALLGALNRPGPDASQPYTDRLVVLRGSDLPSLRRVFRRVFPKPIATSSAEVQLPRGSTILHLYAVTAIGRNRVESDFPGQSKAFFAVATPRAPIPAPPVLVATVDLQATQPSVHLRVSVDDSPAVDAIELFRISNDTLAQSADTMGSPAHTLIPVDGVAVVEDVDITPGWQRTWYRAVAWSADDAQVGLVQVRSTASNPVSVLLTPSVGPEVDDLNIDEPGTTSTDRLVSWKTDVPAVPSPVGSHLAIVDVREQDAPASAVVRLEGTLDSLAVFDAVSEIPPADPAHRQIVRVGTHTSYRLYAWLPQSQADRPLTITVKVIDPAGRIGSATRETGPP